MLSAKSFAPGRVELLGNHTDYNGGVVLSAATHLGISAQGKTREDGKVVLTSEGIPGVVCADLGNLKPADSWSDYPLGVTQVLKEAGYPIKGYEADFSSTLPLGAGLSSSAALEVCTALLLSRLFDFQIDPLPLAKLARKAENEFVGVSCGLLDQVSSVFGEKEHAIFLDCRAESVETIPFPQGVGLIIINSGVKHALTGGEYNERRDQCFEAARLMGVPALRDVTSEQLEAAKMPDIVKRRARHVVGENERVFAALQLLRAGDAAGFGKLMSASHQSSIENFENSTPELDAIVTIAKAQKGIYGARLTGGGFGGAVVALADNDAYDTVAPIIAEEYKKATGHDAATYRCEIGDGAILHT